MKVELKNLKEESKGNKNVLKYGRQSVFITMILFFIAGTAGVMTNNAIAVRGGFVLAIISSIFVIFMTLKLQGERKE